MKPSVALFTDGACKKTGQGGWAYVLRHLSSGKELEGSGAVAGSTSQRMELQAALSGLQRLTVPCKVRLVSDSQYLVKGLNTWLAQWVKNQWFTAGEEPVKNRDLWESLLTESRRHEITAEWVRGHAGHVENERCDVLAVAASRSLP